MQQVQLEINDSKRKVLRRTSSLQLPLSKNVTFSGTLTTAFSTIKASTISLYESTISAAGLLETGTTRTESPLNMYVSMARYRCCFGFCRLRVGSLAIALFSIIYPIFIIVALYIYGDKLTPLQQTYIKAPTYAFLGYQLFSSVLMLTGLFLDLHTLLVPFQLSLVFNVMGTMSLAILLMVSTEKSNTHLFPIFAISSILAVGIYIWFIIISCLTFVLIRDKSRLTDSELDIYRNENFIKLASRRSY
ncbi:hypothetical protein M3Y97_00764500 [Aphelenchoides bicaudatus]|nr:hypothetical protein M3Y97_00764500 [Aphelenchoides bicaudatus]